MSGLRAKIAAAGTVIAALVAAAPQQAFEAAGGGLMQAQTQPPPPQTQPDPEQQRPVFRTEVDVIRLDVSVLDKDRKPVRGLTLEDFTVLENGKPQRIVAVSEIDAVEYDSRPSPWMRSVPRDVAYNDLTDQVGDGRLFAIVMDDVNMPWEAVGSARGVGRYLIDNMGPSDIAAVVYPGNGGRSQDFTANRDRLIASVDRFDLREPDFVPSGNTNYSPGPGGGDMPQRFSPVLGPTNCERRQPIVPAFETIVSRLATVREKRKTVFFVSGGVGLPMGGAKDECLVSLADRMQMVFRAAQRANINIHSIDPAGYRGPGSSRSVRRDFLEIMAEDTGGHAVVNTDDVLGGIDDLFAEGRAYYLIGYQTSNGEPDGKFRKLEVKVNRKDVQVRTRSGYYAARPGEMTTRESREAPSTNDLKRVGLMNSTGLPIRGVGAPLAPAGTGRDADVAVVLSVRLPPPLGTIQETVTTIRNDYDERGNAGPLIRDQKTLILTPAGGDELRYDLYYRFTLPPGRHDIRLHASSAALEKSGTVYVEVVVPDFSKPGLTLTPTVLGTRPIDGEPRTDPFADLAPVVPTTAREFSPNEQPVAFMRVFQGGDAPIVPVTMAAQILDVNDRQVFQHSTTLAPDAFQGRSAPYLLPLSLDGLYHGPYLLSIQGTMEGGKPVRHDLVFRVR